MKTVGVIPARHASTRFPAKVLAKIGGSPMIEHVWRRASECRNLDQVFIACDHPEVAACAKTFGAHTVMTDPHCASGTDRIAEAAKHIDCDVVVNIQGDEPFVHAPTIDRLAALLKNDPQVEMGTVVKELTDEQEMQNPNVVKCVLDLEGYALYFSRSPIPYNRNKAPVPGQRYKHLGLYAYRKSLLLQFPKWPKSFLEQSEQLEQLRVLQNGHRIKTVTTDVDTMAVDVPEDLQKAEEWLKRLS